MPETEVPPGSWPHSSGTVGVCHCHSDPGTAPRAKRSLETAVLVYSKKKTRKAGWHLQNLSNLTQTLSLVKQQRYLGRAFQPLPTGMASAL